MGKGLGKVVCQLQCTVYFSTTAVFILCFYSLDPEQKDCLIEVIEKLLKDKTTVRNYFNPEMDWLQVKAVIKF